MRIIHNADISIPATPASVVLLNGENRAVHYLDAPAVDAIALINCSFVDCSIESSVDNVTWTSRVASLVPTPVGLIATFTEVTGAKHWRVVNNGATGNYSFLFVGKLTTIRNPTFPLRYEKDVIATDKKTLGGVGYSKIRYSAKEGKFNFALNQTDNALFRTIYEETSGFRKPVVIEVPATSEVSMVRAPSKYPFTLDSGFYWTGAWSVEGLV